MRLAILFTFILLFLLGVATAGGQLNVSPDQLF
jgi:hypothetical protein